MNIDTTSTESRGPIANWTSLVERSYAHNSALYRYLGKYGNGSEILEFLRWDAEQPPFFEFLQRWLPKCPESILPALHESIAEEVEDDHSGLYRQMMTGLEKRFSRGATTLDHAVLARLNYTFSGDCARERSFGFFCGSFYATEIMSAKRCEQLLQGLLRLDVPLSELEYLRIHVEGDQRHFVDVRDKFLQPLLATQPTTAAEIAAGVRDRLERSGSYLRWYESRYLKI